ncbi:MAG TPA: hypothetical protein VF278_21940 [Pirellulales bacterium]
MTSPLGEAATLWTVRLALAGYFLGAALPTRAASSGRRRLDNIAWTVGCFCYLAHVACAFAFYHHWSHAAAVERTAEQTALVTGWRWGGGLYVNYVFTAVWLIDVILRWSPRSAGKARPWWPATAVGMLMWFIVFNATVVFGQGAVRWFGLAGCLAVPLARTASRLKMWTISTQVPHSTEESSE